MEFQVHYLMRACACVWRVSGPTCWDLCPGRSGQRSAASDDSTPMHHTCALCPGYGGWPATATRLPETPDRQRYESSCMALSRTLKTHGKTRNAQAHQSSCVANKQNSTLCNNNNKNNNNVCVFVCVLNIRQLSSSEPSSQSSSPSHSGFSLLMQRPVLQRNVNSEHFCNTRAANRHKHRWHTGRVTQ